MHNDKFCRAYVNFITEQFGKDTHKFYIWGGLPQADFEFPVGSNVCVVGRGANSRLQRAYLGVLDIVMLLLTVFRSRKVYFHGLFNERLLFLLSLFRFVIKRGNWVVWGGDLYDLDDSAWNRRYFLLSRKELVRRIPELSVMIHADFVFARKRLEYRGVERRALYLNAFTLSELDLLKECSEQADTNVINIMIGNSATVTNHHKEILNSLSAIRARNIRIFAPLAYGDTNYGKEIIRIGYEIFGDKFRPITEFMEPSKYARFLATMDAAVFYNDRQQALGNIFTLLFLGKKVYLNESNPAWAFLKNDLGITLFKSDDIFTDPEKLVDATGFKSDNSYKIRKLFEPSYIRSIWTENFEA